MAKIYINTYFSTGRRFDAEGNLNNWWDTDTAEKYVEKTQCIINQYGNYTDESVGMELNGVNTQGENIADNAGFKQAYRAYGKYHKVDFSPISCKKHHSTLEMNTFKVMLLFLISLRSIINLAHDFKCPFLDIEITIIDMIQITHTMKIY